MANVDLPRRALRLTSAGVGPETPAIQEVAAILHWKSIDSSRDCVLVQNGKTLRVQKESSFTLPVNSTYSDYQASAISQTGFHSFLSVLAVTYARDREIIVEAEQFASPSTEHLTGFTGNGVVELSRSVNREVSFDVKLKRPGTYSVEFRYSNGSGPVNTDNQCAIRTLVADGTTIGAIVVPQRGKND